jgi:hypothetical protein
MVVRLLFLCFFITFLNSCCITGKKNEFGYLRSTISEDKIFKDFKQVQIDTNHIYSLRYNFSNSFIESADTLKYGVSYLKFYQNGRGAKFTAIGEINNSINQIKDYKTNRIDFDPNAKAKMGYVVKNHNKLYYYSLGTRECSKYWYISELEIYKDSIIMFHDHNKKNGSIWIKEYSIPKEYLENWKPDW